MIRATDARICPPPDTPKRRNRSSSCFAARTLTTVALTLALASPTQGESSAGSPAPAWACEPSRPRLITRIYEPESGYERACLKSGARHPYYVDRGDSHTLAGVPPALEGAEWIRTTNTADKRDHSEHFLEFFLSGAAIVHVGYDSRMLDGRRSAPDWLTRNFEDTGCLIDVSEPDPSQEFRVFRRVYRRNSEDQEEIRVVLGGNAAAGAEFGKQDGSNYVVAVTPGPIDDSLKPMDCGHEERTEAREDSGPPTRQRERGAREADGRPDSGERDR